jgi:polysaccharide pyruvyl transferase WcaK-like protein
LPDSYASPGIAGPATALRVGVFGPYSSSNLGDTATQIAVMGNLKRVMARLKSRTRIEFVGIGSDPADIARTHGVPALDMTGTDLRSFVPGAPNADVPSVAWKWRRYLPAPVSVWLDRLFQVRNIFRLSRQIDVLVISGGGQLDDFWGGPWGRPFELLAWTMSCRIRRQRVMVFATGVDNLRTRLGSWLCVRAIKQAHYVALRDQWSIDFLRKRGVTSELVACPDAAFSLPMPASAPAAAVDSRYRILACPISERAWRHSSDSSYQSYIDAFVDLCVALIANGHNVCLSNSQSGMDIPIVDSVEVQIRSALLVNGVALAPGDLEIHHAHTVEEFVNLAAGANLVVASRLHGVILPLAAGTPVVAISYMRKVSQLMVDVGLSQYSTNLDTVHSEPLLSLVNSALHQQASLRSAIANMNVRMRRDLELQYETMARQLQR